VEIWGGASRGRRRLYLVSVVVAALVATTVWAPLLFPHGSSSPSQLCQRQTTQRLARQIMHGAKSKAKERHANGQTIGARKLRLRCKRWGEPRSGADAAEW
jgi:hypothetical protein